MKSFNFLLWSVTAAFIQVEVQYPEFIYRVGYKEPIIEQYDENDQLVVDQNENPVKQDFIYDRANLFQAGSCIRVLSGADSIQISELPAEFRNFPPDQTYGWVMYPYSNSCNAEKLEGDTTKQEIALSLAQGRWGYRQNTGVYSQGFPYPVSFRLFINPEIINQPGQNYGISLPFTDVGANVQIPSRAPRLVPDDLEFARPATEWSQQTERILNRYRPFNMQIYQPNDEPINRMLPPMRRLDLGPDATQEELDNFQPYPKQYYPVFDGRPPAEVLRPIEMLNRLRDDVANEIIVESELDPVEVSAFLNAFIGPPLPGVIPPRYNWPGQLLIDYLNKLEGFQVPVDTDTGTQGFISPDGHTVLDIFNIASYFKAPMEAWLQLQDDFVMRDWGTETEAQAGAEQWLYNLEEGSWYSAESGHSAEGGEDNGNDHGGNDDDRNNGGAGGGSILGGAGLLNPIVDQSVAGTTQVQTDIQNTEAHNSGAHNVGDNGGASESGFQVQSSDEIIVDQSVTDAIQLQPNNLDAEAQISEVQASKVQIAEEDPIKTEMQQPADENLIGEQIQNINAESQVIGQPGGPAQYQSQVSENTNIQDGNQVSQSLLDMSNNLGQSDFSLSQSINSNMGGAAPGLQFSKLIEEAERSGNFIADPLLSYNLLKTQNKWRSGSPFGPRKGRDPGPG
ncbi:hypothetical protein ABW20_dc0106813 [Dactylellina cionopaga]|nr:hypothetical protein ABW20_dc0106813 [Dactylellina cionopaga]